MDFYKKLNDAAGRALRDHSDNQTKIINVVGTLPIHIANSGWYDQRLIIMGGETRVVAKDAIR